MEQNNLLMMYMKSEHCFWEQMSQGTEKDGRLKESHLNGKLKTNFFFSVLDGVLQPQRKQTLSKLFKPPFFSHHIQFQHRLFLMKEFKKGKVR